MRRSLYLGAVLLCALSYAQTDVALSPLSPEAVQAEKELSRIKELVSAGALPKKALEEAEDAVAEARDQGILHALLYGKLSLEELNEQQARAMCEAAERGVARKQRRLDRAQQRVDLGVAAMTSLTPFLEDLEASKRVRDLAQVRARLFDELVTMARAEEAALDREDPGAPATLPHMERYQGIGSFSTAQFKSVVLAFEHEFRKPLPISANGETALHKTLGFDHRGRVDVALYPDSKEGLWLRRYLETLGIAYLAFRTSVPGQATAAHIHIGPPSARVRRAD